MNKLTGNFLFEKLVLFQRKQVLRVEVMLRLRSDLTHNKVRYKRVLRHFDYPGRHRSRSSLGDTLYYHPFDLFFPRLHKTSLNTNISLISLLFLIQMNIFQ